MLLVSFAECCCRLPGCGVLWVLLCDVCHLVVVGWWWVCHTVCAFSLPGFGGWVG
jgi:hypothetical protein